MGGRSGAAKGEPGITFGRDVYKTTYEEKYGQTTVIRTKITYGENKRKRKKS